MRRKASPRSGRNGGRATGGGSARRGEKRSGGEELEGLGALDASGLFRRIVLAQRGAIGLGNRGVGGNGAGGRAAGDAPLAHELGDQRVLFGLRHGVVSRMA